MPAVQWFESAYEQDYCVLYIAFSLNVIVFIRLLSNLNALAAENHYSVWRSWM